MAGEKIVSDITGLWESRHKWLHQRLASKQGDVDGDIICQYIRQVIMQSRMEVARRWYMTTASGSASGRGKLLGTKIVLIYAHPWVLFGWTAATPALLVPSTTCEVVPIWISAQLRCPFRVLITSNGRANRIQHGDVFEQNVLQEHVFEDMMWLTVEEQTV